MKINYLFHNRFKLIGWIVLLPTLILAAFTITVDWTPDILDLLVPGINFTKSDAQHEIIQISKNNLLNEVIGILLIISLLLVAFSKEKLEDEYIEKIRLESLVWAVYFNSTILFLSLLLVYDLNFYWVMVFNLFTTLIFFIIRFNWKLFTLKKTANNEE